VLVDCVDDPHSASPPLRSGPLLGAHSCRLHLVLIVLGRASGRLCGRFRLKALCAFGEKTPTLTPGGFPWDGKTPRLRAMTAASARDYERCRFTRSPRYSIRYGLRPPEWVRSARSFPRTYSASLHSFGWRRPSLRLVLGCASYFVLLASPAGSAYASSHLSQPTSGARIQERLRPPGCIRLRAFSSPFGPDPRPKGLGSGSWSAPALRTTRGPLRFARLVAGSLRSTRSTSLGSRPCWVASLHARRSVSSRSKRDALLATPRFVLVIRYASNAIRTSTVTTTPSAFSGPVDESPHGELAVFPSRLASFALIYNGSLADSRENGSRLNAP
jgi:hypothetical protein